MHICRFSDCWYREVLASTLRYGGKKCSYKDLKEKIQASIICIWFDPLHRKLKQISPTDKPSCPKELIRKFSKFIRHKINLHKLIVFPYTSNIQFKNALENKARISKGFCLTTHTRKTSLTAS